VTGFAFGDRRYSNGHIIHSIGRSDVRCSLSARALAGVARKSQETILANHIDGLLHERAIQSDLAYYESPSYLDTLSRACRSSNERVAEISSNILGLSNNLLVLVGSLILVATIHWCFLLVLLLVITSAAVAQSYFSHLFYS
jgi:ATP-binding cassette, subfamily B, bacterial